MIFASELFDYVIPPFTAAQQQDLLRGINHQVFYEKHTF